MNKLNAKLILTTAILFFGVAVAGMAQAQLVTLEVDNIRHTASFDVSTNQVITIAAYDNSNTNYPGSVLLSFANGITLSPQNIKNGAAYTGLTSIGLSASSSQGIVFFPSIVSFTVTTPYSSLQSIIPANAVVIPTDATGPVQIVLESSGDLVNWTSSLPGTYGNTYTNRFFRVRAIAQ